MAIIQTPGLGDALTIQGRGLGETLKRVRQMPNRLARARKQAINRTARNAEKFTAKKVYDSVNIPKSDIIGGLDVIRATRVRPEATLKASPHRRLLYRFKSRVVTARAKHPSRSKGFAQFGVQPGRKFHGVSVQIRRGGTRARLPGGFLLELRNHAIGLAVRKGKGKKAYKVLHGPSVHQVVRWNAEDIQAFIRQDLARTFDEEWGKELERIR